MELKIGCDPEFFLYDTENKMHVSAHDFVPGNKRNPYPLDAGAVQVDGTAVEFNIEPATSSNDFSNNITTVLKQIREMIPNRYIFDFSPAIVYDKKYWETIPENCKELGCDPDYDINGVLKAPPKPIGSMRTAGGHIHLGWTWLENALDEGHMKDCITLNRKFSSNIQISWDNDTERKKMYGNNSPFRPKKYGLESRGLSNAWVKYPALYKYIFDYATACFESLLLYPTFKPFPIIPSGWNKKVI